MRATAIDPGQLRDRVALLTPTRTTDMLRGQATSWSVLDTVWAEWLDRPSREALQAGALQSTQMHTARVRYRSDLTPRLRVSRLGVTCDITAVRDLDGRQRFLELDLVEVP